MSDADKAKNFVDMLTDVSVLTGFITKEYGDEVSEKSMIAFIAKAMLVGILDTEHRGIILENGNTEKIAGICNAFANVVYDNIVKGESIDE